MSLPHVLLGMLAEPASGYDLGQFFGQSVRHFWSAELSQIYPALARLERDGLLKSRQVPSEKGPRRKVYTRTAQGTRALRDWLAAGPNVRTERFSYLTQVFFLEELAPEKRRRFMQALKHDFEEHIAELEAVERGWQAQDPRYPDELPDEAFYKQLTLRHGLLRYRAAVAWCEECLQRMRERESG